MIGSQLAMPIIVLNMGGEMIYILNQRLQAQNIPEEKSRKVLGDVIRTMYTPAFMGELFKAQEIYTTASTKQIFEKLAHSSIMRLNKNSMDKLYDLMTMGVKYQLLACKSPHQYLQVTLNHLDTLIDLVKMDGVTELVQVAISKSIELYSRLSNGNWLLLEQALLKFFQDKKTKVSLFLQQELQATNGALILNNAGSLPFGTEVPGRIRYYENDKVVKEGAFPCDLADDCFVSDTVLDSSLSVGRNIYQKSSDVTSGTQAAGKGAKTTPGDKSEKSSTPPSSASIQAAEAFIRQNSKHSSANAAADSKSSSNDEPQRKINSQRSAKAELTMLADLLGVSSSANVKAAEKSGEIKPFKINLFPNQGFSAKPEDAKGGGADFGGDMLVIDIDARADAKTMEGYMQELDWRDLEDDAKADGKDDEDDDLLALMDNAK